MGTGRVLPRLLALVVALWFCVGGGTEPVLAQDGGKCTFCNNPLEVGVNPLKCPNCIKLATAIRKRHRKVWVLGFKRKKLGRVQIKDDTGTPENYFYLTYELTNNDRYPRSFFVDISAHSDRGKKKFIYRDTHIKDVYETVRKIEGFRKPEQKLLSKADLSMPQPEKRNETPEKIDPENLTRRTAPLVIRPDDDKDGVGKFGLDFTFLPEGPPKGVAKISLPVIQPKQKLKCVAILGPFHPEMDRLVIKIRGLTNWSLLEGDGYVAPKGKPHQRMIKEAVLELHYSRPGDEFAHTTDPIKFVRRKWTDVKRVLKSDLPSRSED